jgi:DNA polymerase III alpha subunit (gram-positive type)
VAAAESVAGVERVVNRLTVGKEAAGEPSNAFALPASIRSLVGMPTPAVEAVAVKPEAAVETDESDEVDEAEEAIRIAFIQKAAASINSYFKSDEAKAANEAKAAADVKSKAAAKVAKVSQAKAVADAKAAAEAKADADAKSTQVKAAAEAALWSLVKAPVKVSKAPVKPIHTPQSLIKTMMCTSVVKNVQCRHGKTCRYAHTIDECNPVECKWGAKCRNGNCGYFHSAMESKLDWVKRTCRC